jgi:hypothetical protein
VRFVFEPDGEPPTDVAAEGDPERPETYATDYHHQAAQGDDGQQAPATGTQAAASQQQQQQQQPSQWEESQRPAWQRHSDLGPNVDPEPSQLGAQGDRRAPRAPARPGDEGLVNPREAEGFRYDRHWAGFDGARARTTWERLPEVLPAVGDESLDRRTLNDDYQQLFLCVVLDHARRTLEALAAQQEQEAAEVGGADSRGGRPAPGAPGRRAGRGGHGGGGASTAAAHAPAGAAAPDAPGHRRLRQDPRGAHDAAGAAAPARDRGAGPPAARCRLELANPDTFVRVAAPTGSAAFNIRFGATTIHRLIHWFRPGHFEELRNDVALNRLQTSLGPTAPAGARRDQHGRAGR